MCNFTGLWRRNCAPQFLSFFKIKQQVVLTKCCTLACRGEALRSFGGATAPKKSFQFQNRTKGCVNKRLLSAWLGCNFTGLWRRNCALKLKTPFHSKNRTASRVNKALPSCLVGVTLYGHLEAQLRPTNPFNFQNRTKDCVDKVLLSCLVGVKLYGPSEAQLRPKSLSTSKDNSTSKFKGNSNIDIRREIHNRNVKEAPQN